MPSLNAARTSLSVNRFFHRVFAIGESSSRHPTRAVPGRTRLLRVAGGRVDYCTAEEVMAEKKPHSQFRCGLFLAVVLPSLVKALGQDAIRNPKAAKVAHVIMLN